MPRERRPVELLEKNTPRQERAKRTYENILTAAAELLVEVGVERISTNLIAERAGITVPALYRYFPNKYSVLHALGASLMDEQNRAFADWFEQFRDGARAEQLLRGIDDLLIRTLKASRNRTGGLEILQTLRAVGPLQEVRLDSHALVAERFGTALAQLLGWQLNDRIRLAARMSVEVGYAVIEMALESEEARQPEILAEGARMIELYWRPIVQAP